VSPPSAIHSEITGSGPRLVLFHGFTQTCRLWGPFGDELARAHTLVHVDLPGHGGSAGVRAGFEEGTALLADTIAEPSDVLGYSLGARWALHLALARPDLVTRLVTIGGTPGIRDGALRAERRRRDDAMAAALERSGDVGAFVARWLATPLFVGLDASVAGAGERERNTAAGLASSLRLAGAGVQASLWERLGELGMPALFVAGAQDVRYGEVAAEMARLAPAASAALIPGAGHTAHLERPTLAGAVIGHWLAATGPGVA
jgi:2-succinyl-6-hydroxy-2,4-cyclohexadiene-1-carboxylate synthase